jgi:hypothetical protein
MLKALLKHLHLHIYSKPVLSRYISFNQRDILYECRCGKKICKRVQRNYGSAFPIETTICLTKREFDEVLNNPLPYNNELSIFS